MSDHPPSPAGAAPLVLPPPSLVLPPFPAAAGADGDGGLPHPARILVIDDEPVNVALLEDLLGSWAPAARLPLRGTSDSRQALALYREFRPDLILLDLIMPEPNGFAVMAQLAQEIPAGTYLPILVLTADASVETRRRALAAGATDFLSKPFDCFEALLRIRTLLLTRAQHLELAARNNQLESAVEARTRELREAMRQLQATQQQVIQQERLSALGTLVAGIAHDFNNTLSVVMGNAQLALLQLRRPESSESAGPLVQAVLRSAENAASLVHRLHEFARPGRPDEPRRELALGSLVAEALEQARPRWAAPGGPAVEVRTELAPDLPAVLGDAAELREALVNLIFNAVDAMPTGGTLTLRTRTAAGRVWLEVADNGTGMDEETRRRCLEPFYSTKGSRGTGLGLAMVYGTVQRHGGSIALSSTPGQGTTFTLALPLPSPEERRKAAGDRAGSAPAGSNGRPAAKTPTRRFPAPARRDRPVRRSGLPTELGQAVGEPA